jgi:hypothetical protein
VAVSISNAGKPDRFVNGDHLVAKFLKEWLHSYSSPKDEYI